MLHIQSGTDVVALLLVPVHGQLSTNRAIARRGVGTAIVRISTASAGESGLAKALGANISSDFALESIHVHCDAMEVRNMDVLHQTVRHILCSEPLSI